jgi:hypothetical protein
VNLTTETATITLTGPPPARGQLINAVRRAGYDADTFRAGNQVLSGLDRTQAAKLREQKQALGQAVAAGVPIIALHWLGSTLQSVETGGHVWPVAIQACSFPSVSPSPLQRALSGSSTPPSSPHISMPWQ